MVLGCSGYMVGNLNKTSLLKGTQNPYSYAGPEPKELKHVSIVDLSLQQKSAPAYHPQGIPAEPFESEPLGQALARTLEQSLARCPIDARRRVRRQPHGDGLIVNGGRISFSSLKPT